MSVDVATLVYEFVSDSAIEAEKRMGALDAAAERVEASARRVKTATELAGIGISNTGRASTDAVKSLQEQARANGVVEQSSKAAAAAQKERAAALRSSRALEAAAMRELVQATKAYERDQAAAARQVAAEQRAAAQAEAAAAKERARQVREARALEAAAMRELVAATRAYERDQAAAAKAAAQAQAAADREAERSAQQALAFRVRIAHQRAAEEAAVVREAQRAQEAADRAAERSAQDVLAFRVRMARQRAAEEAAAAAESARAVVDLERRMTALKASIDPVGAAQDRVNAELREASDLYRMGAISAEQYATATRVLNERHSGLVATQGRAVASSKGLQLAALDLSRQFADIGVSLAGGLNPLLILAQQGPQIADRMAMMKMEGIGLRAALGGIAAEVAPVVGALGPLLIVAGAATAAFGLFHRELNKGDSSKELIASLHLTEEQLKRVKDETITFGDTMKATFNVLGRYIMESPVGDAIRSLRDQINAWLDDFAKNTVREAAQIVGALTGAYEGVVAVWKNFPAVMGDMISTAGNALVTGIEWAVNKAIDAYNKVLPLVKALMLATGNPGGAVLGRADHVDFGTIPNANSGAMANVGAAVQAGYQRGFDGTMALASRFATDVAAERNKLFLDRVREKAGDPNKSRSASDPRDMSDERLAEVTRALADAKAAELQATLAITQDVHARAELERQILAAEAAAKQAEIDRKVASIADDKGLSEAQKKALTLAWNGVAAQEAVTALIKQRAINENEAVTKAKQRLDLEMAERDSAVDLMRSRADLLKSSYARAAAERDILDIQRENERYELEKTIANEKLKEGISQELLKAQQRLGVLDQIYDAQRAQLESQLDLANAVSEAVSSVDQFKSAFSRHDWAGAFNSLIATVQTVQASIAAGGGLGRLGNGVATSAAVAGSLIGGRAGNALMNGVGAAILPGMLVSAGSMGALGGLSGGALALGMSLGPLAPVLGIVAGLATLLGPLLKGKPSNNAAIASITGDAYSMVSTGKETDETRNAVGQAAQAIIDAQMALKSLGATLTTTVTAIDLGTRDLTHIFLSTGEELRSAVGDPAAAVEAGLKAVLQGATFADEGMQRLVSSMVAAGKAFDDITASMQAYQAAQTIPKTLADAILSLKDPDAYARAQLDAAQAARRSEVQSAYDAGYLTAGQLEAINAQLKELEQLEVADLMKSKIEEVVDGVKAAADALTDAYNRQSSALQQTIDQYTQLAASLRQYGAGLSMSGLPTSAVYGSATGAFSALQGRVRQGDLSALDSVQTVGNAYLQATYENATDALSYARARADVRRLATDAANLADLQASIAEQQLKVMKDQYETLLNIDSSLQSFGDAVLAYLEAVNAKANDNESQADDETKALLAKQNELLEKILLTGVGTAQNTAKVAYYTEGAMTGQLAMTTTPAEDAA